MARLNVRLSDDDWFLWMLIEKRLEGLKDLQETISDPALSNLSKATRWLKKRKSQRFIYEVSGVVAALLEFIDYLPKTESFAIAGKLRDWWIGQEGGSMKVNRVVCPHLSENPKFDNEKSQALCGRVLHLAALLEKRSLLPRESFRKTELDVPEQHKVSFVVCLGMACTEHVMRSLPWPDDHPARDEVHAPKMGVLDACKVCSIDQINDECASTDFVQQPETPYSCGLLSAESSTYFSPRTTSTTDVQSSMVDHDFRFGSYMAKLEALMKQERE